MITNAILDITPLTLGIETTGGVMVGAFTLIAIRRVIP